MVILILCVLSLADFGHPFVVQVHRPDGQTIAVQIAVDNCSPTPPKSEFREWMDPRIVFLVESSKEAPDVLVLRLYEAKVMQAVIRFPRQAEEEREEDGP